tara:strand:+ start:3047 stop:3265 length:219 start_codon:yes stop_codon:yes gene_type:complete
MISIYGKDFCPYCDKAVALVEQKGEQYEYKKLGRDFTRDDLMETFPGARTFPQIIYKGEKIGGYDNLVEKYQ